MADFSPLTSEIVGRTQFGRNVFRNEDGSSSSERTTTIEFDGKHYNIPTIFEGREVSPDMAHDIIFRQNNGRDPETGEKMKGFQNRGKAEKAAQERSNKMQILPLPVT
jgi:hypothetical protein